MDNPGKTRERSLSVMTELVLPNDGNLLGNLLGGRLLHWIDIAGALAASRHSGGAVATIRMDPVEFKHPIHVGGIVSFTSYVTWTGRTSIETAVETFAEDVLTGEKRFINKVYLVFVALDQNGGKRITPPLIPKTDEEQREWDAAVIRRRK
ncbi:MAG: acyl-CoA thioesterase [Clostridiales bacterium]|jgi:acyl-CoA hydrolase|nr:acyl-CoA thioesterase [Clostridiales bacterium]